MSLICNGAFRNKFNFFFEIFKGWRWWKRDDKGTTLIFYMCSQPIYQKSKDPTMKKYEPLGCKHTNTMVSNHSKNILFRIKVMITHWIQQNNRCMLYRVGCLVQGSWTTCQKEEAWKENQIRSNYCLTMIDDDRQEHVRW